MRNKNLEKNCMFFQDSATSGSNVMIPNVGKYAIAYSAKDSCYKLYLRLNEETNLAFRLAPTELTQLEEQKFKLKLPPNIVQRMNNELLELGIQINILGAVIPKEIKILEEYLSLLVSSQNRDYTEILLTLAKISLNNEDPTAELRKAYDYERTYIMNYSYTRKNNIVSITVRGEHFMHFEVPLSQLSELSKLILSEPIESPFCFKFSTP